MTTEALQSTKKASKLTKFGQYMGGLACTIVATIGLKLLIIPNDVLQFMHPRAFFDFSVDILVLAFGLAIGGTKGGKAQAFVAGGAALVVVGVAKLIELTPYNTPTCSVAAQDAVAFVGFLICAILRSRHD